MATERRKPEDVRKDEENRDPLSGEKGAHPVGAGVGAAVGGAAAGVGLGAAGAALGAGALAGATAGTVAGPVGAAVGAVAGGVIGGLVGKGVAENINPTIEEDYWRSNYQGRPYVDKGASFEDYRPAYRYGWESRARYEGRTFDEAEPEMQSGWDKARASSRLAWDRARHAARDAWDRVSGHGEGARQDRPLPKKG